MLNFERLAELRKQKDAFFKSHLQSPLTEAQKADFTGLSYYPPNPLLRLEVKVQEFEDKEDVQLQTTTGELRWYRRWGEFTFQTEGERARLTIYYTTHGFFLPFVDASAGKETYPAGRYLEPVELEEGRFLIDLNEAYNPYCAYNEGWSCPITPAENRLNIHVRAGETMPQGTWVGKS